jgi:hypothetical protein
MSVVIVAVLVVSANPAPDTVVFCPTEFRGALDPWLAHRARQGHSIVIASNMATAHQIRRTVRKMAGGGRLRYLVLVGDAEPDMAADPRVRARCVPVHWAKAEVNVLWGSEPHIATDNWYADLDDDQVPDIAVGRLTADTPEELSAIVQKTLSYEKSVDFGPWRRKLNFVAGVGGFGMLADMALEAAARYFLTHGIPAAYQVTMTYANWRSPYCPDPRWFHLTTSERLNEGCQFWVYIGHGYHVALDRVRVPHGEHHILANRDIRGLDCRRGLPIALFLACYTGAFDARQDCLAEEMVRTRGAPVAVIAGSRVTMPYAMALMASGLMRECLHRRCETLGEALLRAKQHMARPASDGDLGRSALDAVAALVSPDSDQLAAERAEHLLLFNLIGDPMLRLRHPGEVSLSVDGAAEAGAPIEVTGQSPVDGEATVELVVRRDRFRFDPPLRSEYPRTPGELATFQEVYQRANHRQLVSVKLPTTGGRFRARLPVPEDASGPCHICVFVQGADDYAVGSADIEFPAAIRRAEAASVDGKQRRSVAQREAEKKRR